MKLRRDVLDVVEASGASFAATVADGLIYLVLLGTLVEAGHIGIGVAAAGGAFLGGIVHYTLSRFWVFRRFQAPIAQSAITYFAMSWMAAGLHGLATEWLASNMDPKLAWFCSKGIIWIGWTYPLSRYVVFGGVGAQEDDESSDESR